MRVLDVFTGPNFGVLMAILVILLLQFKSSLLTFFYNAMEDGWQQTLLECMLGLREVIRAYYQMACELLRSVRHGTNDNSPPPLALATARHLMQSPSSLGGSGGTPPPLVVVPLEGEEQQTQTQAQTTASLPPHNKTSSSPRFHKHNSTSSTLESSSSSAAARSQSPSTTSSSSSSLPNAPSIQEEIEPAFLDEKDYPPGWLVYHPVLGVVTKEEADQHDREHPHPEAAHTHTTTTTTPLLAPSIAASG
jgi:hypothetical protein